MRSIVRTPAAGLLPGLLFVLLVPLAFAPSALAIDAVGTTAGKTHGEWSAGWWQWMTSIPSAENPQELQGAVDCSRGQRGPVWYLAGARTGTTAMRSCTVASGKALLFPMLNIIYINEPGENLTVAEKRVTIADFLDDDTPGFLADLGFPGTEACGLFATLDGQPVAFEAAEVRTQSPPFRLDTGDGPNGLPPSLVDPETVGDGYWVMLPPLSSGTHTLRFGGRVCAFGTTDDHPLFGPVDVTYELTVAGDAPERLSNVEIVQSLYTAFAAGDTATILEIIDEDVVWIESEGIPYGGTFIGRDAVFAGVFGKIAAEWTGFTAAVDEFIDAGDRVITLGRDSGTFNATGKSMTAPAASVWTLRDGKVVRFVQYLDTLAVFDATVP